MEDLKDRQREFYNNCEGYKKSLESLQESWCHNCLKPFCRSVSDRKALVLDLDCGIGTTTRYLATEYKKVIGLDYSIEFCKYSRKLYACCDGGVYINGMRLFYLLRVRA
jgi:2-polyprenyl-3-methyl-5-hydroxy-6-metoxy-1,4-benzoquinol methylase